MPTVPSGEVALGGGWIETEFDDLTVTPMADDALKNESGRISKATPTEKENKRRRGNPGFHTRPNDMHHDITLDGGWLLCQTINWTTRIRLFRYKQRPDWHIMSVLNFWTPIRICCMAKTMPSYRCTTQRCVGHLLPTGNRPL